MKKRAILVMVAILMISVFAFSLCACDKDKKDDKNKGIDFTGMTKDEIINMSEKVTSFKYMREQKEGYFFEAYDMINGSLITEMKEYYNGWLRNECYAIQEDGYQYGIFCCYGEEEKYEQPMIEYTKSKIENDPDRPQIDIDSLFRDNLFSLPDPDFTVDGTKIIFESNEDRKVYFSEVNAVKITIPEQFKNYKELAVEE